MGSLGQRKMRNPGEPSVRFNGVSVLFISVNNRLFGAGCHSLAIALQLYANINVRLSVMLEILKQRPKIGAIWL